MNLTSTSSIYGKSQNVKKATFPILFGAILSVFLLASISQAQVSTTTNCTVNGNNVSCNSNSVDYGEQNRQMQQAGANIGAALYVMTARGISAIHQHHLDNSAVKAEAARFCALPENAGSEWELTDGFGKLRHGKCKGTTPAPSPSVSKSNPTAPSHEVSAESLTESDIAKLSDDDKVVVFATRFMHRHPEYIACPENSKALTTYMQSHVKSDLPRESDFEEAYQALKPTGVLKLKG